MKGNRDVLAIEFARSRPKDRQTRFEELAAEWRIWGYRLALKITGCPDAASDAVQEALVRAFKSQNQLSQIESPRAWFRKVLVRCAIDQTVKPLERQMELTAKDEEDAIHVRQILQCLEPNHRAILALSIGEGLSYEEISELLGIPIGTVGSRLFHAKEAFRKAWEGTK